MQLSILVVSRTAELINRFCEGLDAACSLQAVDLKTFGYVEPQGRSLKATGVATSPDKSRQVATSFD